MNTKEIINECLGDLIPKKVLDIGIGKGRCSKRFLKKGSQVFGIDIKKKDNFEGINFIESNIKDFEFKEEYDLIIASLVLHFLKKDVSEKIIKDMKNSTNVGGHNFILTMNTKDNCSKGNESNFYVSKEKLKNLYYDWKIIKSGDFETPFEEHDNLKSHKHQLSFILAKRI